MYTYLMIFPILTLVLYHQFPKFLALIMQISVLYFSPIQTPYSDQQSLHSLISAILFHSISYQSHSPFCEGRNPLFVKSTLVSFCSLAILTSSPPPALWLCDLCSCTGSHTQRFPELGLMLCCCHLESHNKFLARGPTSSFCSGFSNSQCYLPHPPWGIISSTFFCALIMPTSSSPPDHRAGSSFRNTLLYQYFTQLILSHPSSSTKMLISLKDLSGFLYLKCLL